MKISIWLSTLCFSLSSYAATLSFPEEFYPLQVDDKVVEHSLFSKIRDLSLAPGQYRLKLKYSDLYELGYDEHEVVESLPFWVDLVIPEEGEYRIVFDRAKKVDAARRFAKDPSIRLKSSREDVKLMTKHSNEAVAQSVIAVKAPVANMRTIEPVQTQSVSSEPIRTPSAPIAAPPTPAMMLDFWWQQASAEERQAFLQRVQKSNKN